VLVRGSSDLSALRERIPIPQALRGRWAAARQPVHAVAGFAPSPIEIVIWIPVDECAGPSWPTIHEVVGHEGTPMTIALHVDAARALLPERVTAMAVEGAEVRVTGPAYPAGVFEGGGFTAGRAVRIDGGLQIGRAHV